MKYDVCVGDVVCARTIYQYFMILFYMFNVL